MNEMKLEDDGERMIPYYHKGTVMYAEHMTRYIAAQSLVTNKVVLDIACGSGYGTQLLSKKAKKVTGVDIDKSSIDFAKKNYSGNNTEFILGGGEDIPLDDNSVDVVITFETIEHIKDYRKFLNEINRVLKNDGIAIVSTPNEKEFTEGNHFHLHEFKFEELNGLLSKNFKFIKPFFQATWVSVAIAPEEIIQNEVSTNIETYNFMPIGRDKYLYFYIICSNRKITENIKPINAFGGHYSARELTNIRLLNEKNISNYKIVLDNANKDKNFIEKEFDKLKKENEKLVYKIDSIENSKSYKFSKRIAHIKKSIVSNEK